MQPLTAFDKERDSDMEDSIYPMQQDPIMHILSTIRVATK